MRNVFAVTVPLHSYQELVLGSIWQEYNHLLKRIPWSLESRTLQLCDISCSVVIYVVSPQQICPFHPKSEPVYYVGDLGLTSAFLWEQLSSTHPTPTCEHTAESGSSSLFTSKYLGSRQLLLQWRSSTMSAGVRMYVYGQSWVQLSKTQL